MLHPQGGLVTGHTFQVIGTPPFLDPRKPNMDTTKNESLEFGIFEKSMDSFSGGVGIKLAKVSMNRSWLQVLQHVTNKTLVFLQ